MGDYGVDVNGDGKADFLSVDTKGAVHAWLNNGGAGHGGWANRGRITIDAKAPASRVRFADINGDGKANYLVVDDYGAVRAWLNKGGDGHGGWSDRGQMATGSGAPGSCVRFADIDGDGKADYLVVEDNGPIYAWVNNGGDGHGGWANRGQIAAGLAGPGDRARI
ncbi:FG-GAP repeat domain-containing protein [Streptomyces monomycini]|uniref:FG-GAP repeat domain-containing protein n=1 Tax=Streptomyces monomycini TaxID=371720 RepID=UPI00067BC861|nr:VCBS repeat-containing protein [Streptomyces monomycini]